MLHAYETAMLVTICLKGIVFTPIFLQKKLQVGLKQTKNHLTLLLWQKFQLFTIWSDQHERIFLNFFEMGYLPDQKPDLGKHVIFLSRYQRMDISPWPKYFELEKNINLFIFLVTISTKNDNQTYFYNIFCLLLSLLNIRWNFNWIFSLEGK